MGSKLCCKSTLEIIYILYKLQPFCENVAIVFVNVIQLPYFRDVVPSKANVFFFSTDRVTGYLVQLTINNEGRFHLPYISTDRLKNLCI